MTRKAESFNAFIKNNSEDYVNNDVDVDDEANIL